MKKNFKRLILTVVEVAAIAATLAFTIAVIYLNRQKSRNAFLAASYIVSGEENFIETEGIISSASYYGNRYLEDDEKIVLLEDMARTFGINEGLEHSEKRENGRETMTLSKKGVRSNVSFNIVTLEDGYKEAEYNGDNDDAGGNYDRDNNYSCAQYITCEIKITDSPESVFHYAGVLRDYLKQNGLSDDVTVTLINYFDGELDIEKSSELTDAVLKSMGAEIIAENRTKELFSVYAYAESASPSDSEIVLGNDKVNVNIAVNYDETSNRTRVYIAAPLLNIEY